MVTRTVNLFKAQFDNDIKNQEPNTLTTLEAENTPMIYYLLQSVKLKSLWLKIHYHENISRRIFQ